MEIVIRNYLSGSFLLETETNEWDSIVILDSRLKQSQFVVDHSRNALQLRFDDVLETSTNKIAPDSASIMLAICFGLASEKLMVCCRAGQSRSAATAFSIAYEKFGKDRAIEILNPKRHSPNYRILRLAAGLIERVGLLEAYDQWGYDNGDIRLIDYLDEIEQEYDELESIGASDRISNT